MNLIFHLLRPSPVTYHDSYADPFSGKTLSHVYTLNKNAKLVPGVTSIGNNLSKDFLKFWAAKEAVKDLGYFDPKQTPKEEGMARLALCLAEIQAMSPDEYLARLESAKNAHARKTTEAADAGTRAHDWFENYVKARIEGLLPESLELPEDPAVLSAVNAFLAWESAHHVIWYASELVVGSEQHEYGGKLDALAAVDGIPSLIDFKTSNQISSDYAIQTAGYHLALKEMGLEMWQRIILRTPKDGKDFEAWTVPTPLDLDIQAFLALRQIQRWKSYVENIDNGVTDQAGRVKVGKVTIKKAA